MERRYLVIYRERSKEAISQLTTPQPPAFRQSVAIHTTSQRGPAPQQQHEPVVVVGGSARPAVGPSQAGPGLMQVNRLIYAECNEVMMSQMYVHYNLGTVLGDEEQARPCTACPPGASAVNLGTGTEAASSARPSRSVASFDSHKPASGPELDRKQFIFLSRILFSRVRGRDQVQRACGGDGGGAARAGHQRRGERLRGQQRGLLRQRGRVRHLRHIGRDRDQDITSSGGN